MNEFKRTERIADQIKMEVANILAKSAKDPRLQLVTVTYVMVSNDLQHAKVFVSILKHEEEKKVLASLKRASGFVRGEIAKRLNLRKTPAVTFLPDTSSENVSHILDLLDEIERPAPPQSL